MICCPCGCVSVPLCEDYSFWCICFKFCRQLPKLHEYAHEIFCQNLEYSLFGSHICIFTLKPIMYEILQVTALNLTLICIYTICIWLWSHGFRYFLFVQHICSFFLFFQMYVTNCWNTCVRNWHYTQMCIYIPCICTLII